ncbi:hypothetical protein N9L68_07945 [bacterium]|nr:hypothetical protein [bacterium]
MQIESSDLIMQWMVRWAAMLLSRFRKDQNGFTPYEKARGKKCEVETLAFGESVFFRKLEESRGSEMESRWSEGIWLGHSRSGSDVWVGTPNGAVRAWACRRKEEGRRWSGDAVKQIRGLPHRPQPQEGVIEPVVPIEVHVEQDDDLNEDDVAIADLVNLPELEVEVDEAEAALVRRDRERVEHAAVEDADGSVEAEADAVAAEDLAEEEERRRNPRYRTRGWLRRSSEDEADLVSALLAADVAEIDSPVRVGTQAKEFGLKPGEAMDLTTGWDFNLEADRKAAEEYVEKEKPLLLIGSPMCTMFSQLQTLTPWTQAKEEEWQKARRHLQFVMSLYEK